MWRVRFGESCRHGFQVFANYSWLSSGPPIHIAATELRGITIEQLSSLQLGLNEHATGDFQFHFWVSLMARNLNNLKLGRLVFIEDIASSWCDAHHLAYGQPLSVEVSALFGRRFSDRCWKGRTQTKSNERCGYCTCPRNAMNNLQIQPVFKDICTIGIYRHLYRLIIYKARLGPKNWSDHRIPLIPLFPLPHRCFGLHFRPSICIMPIFGSLDPPRLVTEEVAAAM